ncbi:MAG: HEAT repeat domain-containing protein, partial [Planctomyces sp.]
MIYRDIWLGPQYYGNAFTAEPVHNLVSRLVLSAEGAGFQGVRAADEQSSEFLASEDNWFRPTMLRTGPDGAVWVADMYRAVIEHPEWIPAEYQRKLALDSGSDRGRIYRIVPDVGCCSGEQPAVESQENSESRTFFAKDWKTQDLVSIAERVGSVNGWWRDAAQRMLQHRAAEASGHPGVLSALRRLAGSESAAVAAQALATLAMLSEDQSDRDLVPAIQAGLRHADPRVRAMAVQLLEPHLRLSAGEVLQAVASLESDPDERVQLQLVLSLGEVPGDAAAPLLGRLLAAAVNREWVQRAGLTSLTAENVGGVLDAVLRLNADGTEELVGRLLSQAAEFGRAESLGVPVQRMLQRVSEEPGRVNFAAVSGVLRTVLAGSAGDTLRAEKSVQELMEAARRSAAGVAWDVTAESGQRAACVGFLDAVGVEPEKLSDLLQPQVPLEVQRVAASVISRRGGETTVSAVLQAFGGLSPVVREEVLEG